MDRVTIEEEEEEEGTLWHSNDFPLLLHILASQGRDGGVRAWESAEVGCRPSMITLQHGMCRVERGHQRISEMKKQL